MNALAVWLIVFDDLGLAVVSGSLLDDFGSNNSVTDVNVARDEGL